MRRKSTAADMTGHATESIVWSSSAGGIVAGLVIQGASLIGWVIQPSDPARRFVVEIDREDEPLAVLRADTFLPLLRDRGHGDGCYCFVLALTDSSPDAGRQIRTYRLRIANEPTVLAVATQARTRKVETVARLGGTVVWRGGLRLSGTLRGRGSVSHEEQLQVFEGSQRLDVAVAMTPGENPDRERAFDLFIPALLADGALHALRVLDQNGTELDGSPVWVAVDPGGYRSLAQRLGDGDTAAGDINDRMLDYLDLLMPASLPLEDFATWAKAVEEPPASVLPDPARIGVIVVGRLASQPTLASLREQLGNVTVRAGVLDTTDEGSFEPADFSALYAAIKGDTELDAILVARAGSSIRPQACRKILDALSLCRAASDQSAHGLCLADHALFDHDGHPGPIFGPAFDYERMMSQGYGEGLFAATADLVAKMRLGPGRCCSYDILFGLIEAVGPQNRSAIVHLPEIIATVPQIPPVHAVKLLGPAVARHLKRAGVAARIVPSAGLTLPALAIERDLPPGRIEIIIPTRDRLDLLRPCLETLRALTRHPDYRILVVDNGSVEPETIGYLGGLKAEGAINILRDDGVFNYARINNRAAERSSADYLCFLNNDVEIVQGDWLTAMHRVFARRDVGAVGAKLVWPNRMLQHGGVVLGTGFAASHAYDRYLADEPGYMDGIKVARECGALTAACLLVRRMDFRRVGGFDEIAFPVAFNDVDLCLKLRAAGQVLVWTPAAELLHKESASRGSDATKTSSRARADKELAELRRRWGRALMDDPYYNPNLNLDAYAFTALAMPPRDRSPRINARPTHRPV